MSYKIGFLLFLTAPLLMGTTYIAKENGVEVGRWEESDGSNSIKYLENEKSNKTTSVVPKREASTTTLGDTTKSLVVEKHKAQNWGIVKGMTKEEVEKIQKVKRDRKYTESIPSNGGTTPAWVWEYDWETEHFRHNKKVYFYGKLDGFNNDERVGKEVNNSTEKQ